MAAQYDREALRASVEGTVRYLRSEPRPAGDACKCCGAGGHIFGARLEVDPGTPGLYRGETVEQVSRWLDSVLWGFRALEGRRVRLTIEAIEETGEEARNGAE